MSNSKRTYVIGLAVALAAALAPTRSDAVCSGDLVAPAGVDPIDVAVILTCVNNPNAAVCGASCGGAGFRNCADVNLDGNVNIADAVIINNEANFVGGTCSRNIVPICSSPGAQLPCGSNIAADFTTNTTLGACSYTLDGTVFVNPGTVLTIRPGATIRARAVSGDGTPSALIFLRGDCAAINALADPGNPPASANFTARINAAGTPNAPIVFTSDQALKSSGDWAGVAFMGCSTVNDPSGEGDAEGLIGVMFGGGTTPVPLDNSGLTRYVRVEFGGRELSPDNELNVWTQNALGSCTSTEYVQAHAGTDDGFEWFGGTNNAKHLVATANRDDNFDWQLGTTGNVQFGYALQAAANKDTAGSNGLEGDNDEDNFANAPISDPRFCNMTLIGAKDQPGFPGGTDVGTLVRRGTGGRVAKAIWQNWDDGCLQLRDAATAQHACSAGPPFSLAFQSGPQLLIESSICYNNGAGSPGTVGGLNHGSTGAQCNSTDWFDLMTTAVNPITTLNPGLPQGVYPVTDPRPTMAANVASAFDCGSAFGDPFFESTGYVGAFDPAGTNWLDTPGGWINFNLN